MIRAGSSARLDRALALLAADQPDEAAQTALEAVTSGRLVPSNYWRAAEVIRAVQARSVSEATELHEACRELCAPAETHSATAERATPSPRPGTG